MIATSFIAKNSVPTFDQFLDFYCISNIITLIAIIYSFNVNEKVLMLEESPEDSGLVSRRGVARSNAT